MYATREEMSVEDESALWRDFIEGSSAPARKRLIEHYQYFARIIAAKLYANRHFDEIGFDDYLQFATIGLIESIDRFDYQRGVSFTTFASARVRGAVLNGLESLSERQQQISLRKRVMQQRLESLGGDDGDEPNIDKPFLKLVEVAIGLAVGYMLEGSGILQEEGEGYVDNVYGNQELKQLQQIVKALVEGLPDQERHVIQYHYFQSLSFDEVSKLMKLTRGRISQIHRKGLQHLKEAYRRSVTVDLRF
jgi:RNA polymerase sigma factor for flagellar operon FliA